MSDEYHGVVCLVHLALSVSFDVPYQFCIMQ